MSSNQQRNKRDWALAQAVENQRLLRRSEQRKLEAQVNTKCLMRADDRRIKEEAARARADAMGDGGAKASASSPRGSPRGGGRGKDVVDAPLKPAQKKSIMKNNLSKRERAMRRMYGELADDELLGSGGNVGGADGSSGAGSKNKKKIAKKKKKKDENGSGGDDPATAGVDGETAATSSSSFSSGAGAGGAGESAASANNNNNAISSNTNDPSSSANDAYGQNSDSSTQHNGGADGDNDGSGDRGEGNGRKPFGVVFKPYGGDTFGTRGKYTEGMVYQSRLAERKKKKKGILSAFFDPGRPKVVTPREEEEDVVSEVSVDLNSKQRCAATLCSLSGIPSNIENMVREGALDALIKLATGEDTMVQHNVAATLCNMAADSRASIAIIRGAGWFNTERQRRELDSSGKNNKSGSREGKAGDGGASSKDAGSKSKASGNNSSNKRQNSISSAGSVSGTSLDAILSLSHAEDFTVRRVCLLSLFRLSTCDDMQGALVSANVIPALMRLRHDSPDCALASARTIFNLANVREVYLKIEKVIQAAVTIASVSGDSLPQLTCVARTFKTLGNHSELRPRLLEEGVMGATQAILAKSGPDGEPLTDPTSSSPVTPEQRSELTELCCAVLHDLASCPRNRLAMVSSRRASVWTKN